MERKITIITFSLLFSMSTIWGGPTEAVTSLVGRNAEGYLGPIGTILGTDMNSGFYRKASPHKILGFDFTIDVVYAMAPAGQTTYNFVVPNENIGFTIPFKFPKDLLLVDTSYLGDIPGVGDDPNSPDALYKDQEISFDLPLTDLLDAPDEPAQNMLGNSNEKILTVTYDSAAVRIYDQVILNTWEIIKDIDGIGQPLIITGIPEIEPAYSDSAQFSTEFGGEIREAILTGMATLPELKIPIPGGFGESFNKLPIAIGLPMPILQASFGLPFHTELTVRGLPVAMPMGALGSLKFGGFGGKIGISEFFKKKPKKQPKIQISPKIKYVLEELPSNITPADIDSALAEIRTTNMDLSELDMLNSQFHTGDSMAIYDILTQLEKISTIPKRKKSKPKGWPIDVSIGYYTNDLILDMGDAKINSTNNLLSLQVGKTLNLPFISFLGGVGLYGGLGLESSDLNLSYTLANPIAYGCFKGSGDSKTYLENVEKDNCSGGTKEWGSGVPTDISLSFPGENKFRTTIGARIRILFVDVYADYNTGTSNAMNAGVGITFR